MIIIKQHRIYRQDLQANPEVLYIFGDNLQRRGYGGQAKEMRGEPNSIGIATKRRMEYGTPDCYFHDSEKGAMGILVEEFMETCRRIHNAKPKAVIIPLDGIGTGLARLPEFAPVLLEYINVSLKQLEKL